MGWFNYCGLAVMVILMTPNILYFAVHKNGAGNIYRNKAAGICEQIGRYGCFVFMIFNIPYTYYGFWFRYAFTVYLSAVGCLCLAYIAFWIICGNKKGKLKALSLSVIPSCIFLFCGVVLASIPLIVFAVIFAVSHILISVRNCHSEI